MQRLSTLRPPLPQYALLLTLLVLLVLMMLYPLYVGIKSAFIAEDKPSLFWISSSLADATFRSQLLTSLALGLTVTILANLIAFPLALISQRYTFPGKSILAGLVLV